MTRCIPLARALLRHLRAVNFTTAYRYLGTDEQGRQLLPHVEGLVPPGVEQGRWTDEELGHAATLLRVFHGATAGCTLAGKDEMARRNDVVSWNTAFVGGYRAGMIDFNDAHPGP